MMRGTIVLLGAVLLFCPARAQAADVTLFTGYLNPGNWNFSNAFVSNLQLRGTAVYGADFEADYHRILGLDESISFSPNLFSSNLLPSASDVRGFLYSSNVVLNTPLGHFVPYATAGVGFMKPWGSGFKPFGTRFAFNYGGGIKLQRLFGPIGLRFDVRGYTIPDVTNQTVNIMQATGGITFSFGGGR